ncbi:hypothetical protein RHMOL_Rhmol05G0169100 [Rhododendron molle]|uniref:Uncharacterized protein n=1 Tax=Rhododendron molle TaxID=49168 RepID=A0ACC0NPQ3_RHOML|nr:hypothetical protein RHMOL_Rhmol05G0169100 [Rhododendron molle]
MGGDLTDVTISGAKDASGNIILQPPYRHMSISIPASSGLSPATEDVTAAYIRLLQRRDDERDNELAALRAEVAQMKQHMQQTAASATSRSDGNGRQRLVLSVSGRLSIRGSLPFRIDKYLRLVLLCLDIMYVWKRSATVNSRLCSSFNLITDITIR